ncbi:hypothetical protein APT56_05955 [Achromobacter denitrificans]|nr:hypothetical protein APT56_05955 [Achromobacter denitrificans]
MRKSAVTKICACFKTSITASRLLHQISVDLKRSASLMGEIYDDLMAGLADEPCVIERDQDVAELLEDPRKLRKGMAPR